MTNVGVKYIVFRVFGTHFAMMAFFFFFPPKFHILHMLLHPPFYYECGFTNIHFFLSFFAANLVHNPYFHVYVPFLLLSGHKRVWEKATCLEKKSYIQERCVKATISGEIRTFARTLLMVCL